MKKKITTAVTAAALAAVLCVSAFAVGSPVGGITVDKESTVEKDVTTDTGTTTKVTETITTTTEPVKNSGDEVIDIGATEEPIVKVTTVSQADNANKAAGAEAASATLTSNSRTVGQNNNLIYENAKTADAKTTAEGLNKVQTGLAQQTQTYLSQNGMDTNLSNYAQAQTLDVTFNKAAEDLAGTKGVTLTMQVAGAAEGSKGFVQYYDKNGKARLIAVTFGKNGRVRFTLPNSSVVRIYTTVQAKPAQK